MQISGLNTPADLSVRTIQQPVQQTAKAETPVADKKTETVPAESDGADAGNNLDTLA